MEKEKKFDKHRADMIESDPRIIGEKIYRNPIELCYDIDDVILRSAVYNRTMSAELLQIMNNILALTDSIRALFFVKEKNLDAFVNPNDLIELSKKIKIILKNEEFWKLHSDSVFKEENQNYERGNNPALAAKDKRELKKVSEDFANLLNYFALENYSSGRRKH